MPTYSPKILAQSYPSSTTETDVYAVPTGGQAIVTNVQVCNQTSAAKTFRISAAQAAAAANAKQYAFYDDTLQANESKAIKLGWTLGSTDVLRAKVGTANSLSFNVFGIYDSTNANTLLSGLEGYWSFDEASGSSVADSSGNSRTGTATGTTAGTTGKVSNARTFARNTTDRVNVPHASALISPAFTVAGWVYITSNADTYVRVLEKGGAVTSGGYGIEWNAVGASNQLKLVIWNGTNAQSTIAATSISLNTWYHFAGTFDSGNTIVYINGTMDGSGSSQVLTSNTDDLNFGKYIPDSTHTLDGRLDEWGYWSRALTSTEISSLYNSGTGLSYPF